MRAGMPAILFSSLIFFSSPLARETSPFSLFPFQSVLHQSLPPFTKPQINFLLCRTKSTPVPSRPFLSPSRRPSVFLPGSSPPPQPPVPRRGFLARTRAQRDCAAGYADHAMAGRPAGRAFVLRSAVL